MKKLFLFAMILSMCAFLGGSIVMAQETGDQSKPAATASKAATKAKTAMHHHHAAAVSEETLSGTISMVDADKHLVVVTDSNGIPFDFVVNGRTKITVGGQKAKLADLSGSTSKSASVKFHALKKAGNVASSIDVGS